MSVSSRDTAIVIETLNVPQPNPRLCLFTALPETVTQNLKPSKSGAPVEIPANVNEFKHKDSASKGAWPQASLVEQDNINTGSLADNHTHLFKHYINAQAISQASLQNHQVLEKLFTGDLKDVHNTGANASVAPPYISTANRPLPVCISATHGLGETIGDAFWFSNYGSSPAIFNTQNDLKTIFKQISRTWNMFSGGVYTKYETDNGRRPEHSTDMDKTRAFTQKAFTSSPDTSPQTFTPELTGVFSFAPTLSDFPVFCFSAPSEHAVYATLLSSTATTIQTGSTRYTAALNGHC